jgi:hypothetical protein
VPREAIRWSACCCSSLRLCHAVAAASSVRRSASQSRLEACLEAAAAAAASSSSSSTAREGCFIAGGGLGHWTAAVTAAAPLFRSRVRHAGPRVARLGVLPRCKGGALSGSAHPTPTLEKLARLVPLMRRRTPTRPAPPTAWPHRFFRSAPFHKKIIQQLPPHFPTRARRRSTSRPRARSRDPAAAVRGSRCPPHPPLKASPGEPIAQGCAQ